MTWHKYNLGDLVEFSQGIQVPVEEQSESCLGDMVRFIRIVDYTSNEHEPPRYIKNPGLRYTVNESDVVMIRYGSQTAGKVARGISGVIANNTFKVSPKAEDSISKDFLYHFLSQPSVYNYFQSSQSSSTMPAITFNMISNLEIYLPPIVIQKTISKILNSFEVKIRLNNQINKNLESISKAIFKEWFIDFGPVKSKAEGKKPFGMDDETASLFPDSFEKSELGLIPKGWEVKSFSEISNCFDSKRIPLSSAEREKRKGIYPYYGAASHMGNVDDYLFDGIFVLMGEDGSVVNEDGSPVLQYVWGKFWVNNHAHILTGKNISNEHLLLFLKHVIITPYVTGAVQPKLNQGNMNRILFVKAPEAINSAFDKLIEPLFAKIRAGQEENNSLIQTRNILVPKLISGEISLTDEVING